MAPSTTAAKAAAKAEAPAPASDAPDTFTPTAPGVSPQSPEAAQVEAATVARFATGDVSNSGVYVDLATGKVVEEAPVRGRQLVAPGTQITPDRKAAIDAAHAAYAANGPAAVPGFDAVAAREQATAQGATETR